MTNEDLKRFYQDNPDIMEPGDFVIKNESGNMHSYFVTYKEEHRGICLSYMDATIIETVSYDYIEDEWVYNSTDVGYLTSGT